MQTFETLYKKDSNGKMREWRMEVEGDKHRSVSGVQEGQQVTSAWKVAKPKNVGKVNATTGESQALAEVLALYEKRLSGEYHTSMEEVDGARFFKPMLATKWRDRKSKIDYKERVYIQPKLDGIRCIASKGKLQSRSGKDIVSIPHVMKALEPFFDKYPDAVLDGELYNHDLKDDFDEIVSIVRKTKPSAEDFEKSAKMAQYHVYDAPDVTRMYLDRLHTLEKSGKDFFADEPSVKIVLTMRVKAEEDVDFMHEKFLEEGYEGTMIRIDDLYHQKRTNSLIKRKEFEDKEFEIIRVEEGQGNWAGYAKRVVFRNEDGREVGAGLKGNQAYARQVLADADQYVGKKVTIQFFTRTPDGVPRFPIAKALHMNERW